MDRCPNCGSSVRIGAKFCTTCGFRLPSDAPAAPAAAPSRSPFDTTSTASVSSRWPTPEPAPAAAPVIEPLAAPAPQAIDVDPAIPQTAELLAPPAAPAEDPATFTGWPAYGSGFGSRPGWGDQQLAEGEQPLPADLTGGSDVKSVEDAISAWTGTPSETASDVPAEAFKASAEELIEADLGAGSDSLAWFESIEPENVPIDESSLPVQTTEILENAHSGEYEELLGQIDQEQNSIPVDASELVNEEVDIAATSASDEEIQADEISSRDEPDATAGAVAAVAVVAGATASDSSNPAALASALLDELKALLPRLGESGSGAGVNIEEIVTELAAARSSSDEEKLNMQSLRAAIATAQARPRDVDVMLDLVSRSGEIAALFMAHDAYAEAIDRAIEKLKGEYKQEPAPRW